MRQTVRYFALVVLVVLICASVPAVAGNIPAGEADLHRGTRGHSDHAGDAATGLTGNNPFSGGPSDNMRPGRTKLTVQDDDDGKTNTSHGPYEFTPFENDGDSSVPDPNTPTAPVPEPTTLALVAPALLGLVRKLRK